MTESEFEHFFTSLHEPGTPHISPGRVISLLGIRADGLASVVNPTGKVVARNKTPKARMQRCLRDLLRIFSAASANHNNAERLVYWFMNNPLPQFHHRTAFEIYSANRTEELLPLLTATL